MAYKEQTIRIPDIIHLTHYQLVRAEAELAITHHLILKVHFYVELVPAQIQTIKDLD